MPWKGQFRGRGGSKLKESRAVAQFQKNIDGPVAVGGLC